jgi:hypothetical protein
MLAGSFLLGLYTSASYPMGLAAGAARRTCGWIIQKLSVRDLSADAYETLKGTGFSSYGKPVQVVSRDFDVSSCSFSLRKMLMHRVRLRA